MERVPLIEGLRGYLALWVVIDHLLAVCGYGLNTLDGVLFILRSGWYAVDLFVILSGFVIFFLLDNKREDYKSFIIRRFFRIWPLFIFLFFCAIPISKLYAWNVNEFSILFENLKIGDGMVVERINSWWDNIFLHIICHIPMLHGILPNNILPYSPGSFLGPAWSVSLEWQFYLIAPLFFYVIRKFKTLGFILVSLFCAILFIWGISINNIQFGAFLPMHIEFFLLGVTSYYLYKYFSNNSFKMDNYKLPLLFIIMFLIYYSVDFKVKYLPYFIWTIIFSLLIDCQHKSQTFLIKKIGFIFNNKLAIYLGQISYSIYLSHFLVIIIMQFTLIKIAPMLSRKEHFLILSLLTIFITIVLSAVLYNSIEKVFIRKGNRITELFNNR